MATNIVQNQEPQFNGLIWLLPDGACEDPYMAISKPTAPHPGVRTGCDTAVDGELNTIELLFWTQLL